jgi:tellurite resistance-related uncharacterized protein
MRAWVQEAEGRRARLGTVLGCPHCDRAELPDGLLLIRSSREWDDQTMPTSLLRSHRIARGMWGRIVVRHGHLRFVARTDPELDVVLGPDATQAIPPEVEHEVRPLGPVSFSIDFLSIRERTTGMVDDGDEESPPHGNVTAQGAPDEGGEAACRAHLLCPDCGVVLDGGAHMQRCKHGESGTSRS